MKKFLILILIIGLGVGIYFFFNQNKAEVRCGEGFRFVPSTQTCEPVVQEKKIKEIDFSQVKIKLPGSDVEVQLQKNGDTSRYQGKGEISFGKRSEPSDFSKSLVDINLDTKQSKKYSEELILAPFSFNSGGTGQFVYIGLFDVNSNTHLDSISIGDRISIDSIEIVNEKIKVNFKNRLDSESFADTPSIPTQVVLEIKDNKLIQIVKLQNADYNDIEIKSLTIASETLLLKGAIPGSWYFEAVAQFKILDTANNEIGFGYIQALSDWMTTQRVPFELRFTTTTLNYVGDATLLIQSENVQGEEEGERLVKKMYIPITFK